MRTYFRILFCVTSNLLPLSVSDFVYNLVPPRVYTRFGTIEGLRVKTDSGKIVNAFLGIPYAAPPTGKLRFTSPRKFAASWNTTYYAKQYGPDCPQLRPSINKVENNQNEDCLYLNIWTPSSLDGARILYPVLLYIEGEDFQNSSPFAVSGSEFSAEDIVVVTLNYRLNVLGFFCLNTTRTRGNLGLLDQYMALLWVKENIARFGGDAQKITLYGHAAGAISVVLHMISPRTAGLFQRVVINSGSITAHRFTRNNVVSASMQFIRIVGCDSVTRNIMECMRAKSFKLLLNALNKYYETNTDMNKFYPTVDNYLVRSEQYLPMEFVEALKIGTYYQVPILTGISIPKADKLDGDIDEFGQTSYLNQYIDEIKIPSLLRTYGFDVSKEQDPLREIIKWKYFSDNTNVRKAVMQLKFDANIAAPHYKQLSLLLEKYVQPIFAYFIGDVDLPLNFTNNSIDTTILLLFGDTVGQQIHTTKRRMVEGSFEDLSGRMKRHIVNFMLFGHPAPSVGGFKWSKYNADSRYIKFFFGVSHQNHQQLQMEAANFWNILLPTIYAYLSRFYATAIPNEMVYSPDPAAGFRHAMYTLASLVLVLLILLLVSVCLLKRKSKQRVNTGNLYLEY